MKIEEPITLALTGVSVQEVTFKVLPRNDFARSVWPWLKFKLKVTWREGTEEYEASMDYTPPVSIIGMTDSFVDGEKGEDNG